MARNIAITKHSLPETPQEKMTKKTQLHGCNDRHTSKLTTATDESPWGGQLKQLLIALQTASVHLTSNSKNKTAEMTDVFIWRHSCQSKGCDFKTFKRYGIYLPSNVVAC